MQRLGEVWFAKYVQARCKRPEVVSRVLRKHINPVLGPVAPPDVQPVHIDRVLTCIGAGGAPTVDNDALCHMNRISGWPCATSGSIAIQRPTSTWWMPGATRSRA
ncbi:MAG: hypothetical protein ACOVN7_05635, partial [Rubrivivax sp.]